MATIGGVGFHLLLLLRWFLSSFLFLHLISGGSFCLLFRWLSLCLHTRRELREKKKEKGKCHGAKSSHPSFSPSLIPIPLSWQEGRGSNFVIYQAIFGASSVFKPPLPPPHPWSRGRRGRLGVRRKGGKGSARPSALFI